LSGSTAPAGREVDRRDGTGRKDLPMRLHVLSDLHLEFADWTPPALDVDLVVLAGDVHVGTAGVAWAAAAFAGRPVVYVPGNHEYYGASYPRHRDALRRAAAGTCVHVLDCGVLDLPALRVLGCTLWTDFALNGDRRAAMALAGRMMWDYRQIRVSPRQRPAQPTDALRWHRRARAWLARELADRSRPTVVVTHHAPSLGSTSPHADDRPYAPAYASDLEALIAAHGPTAWIHGHTHRARNDHLGATRMVSNPRGYPDQPRTGFAPDFVLDIPSP
jgi:hypothetical protein